MSERLVFQDTIDGSIFEFTGQHAAHDAKGIEGNPRYKRLASPDPEPVAAPPAPVVTLARAEKSKSGE